MVTGEGIRGEYSPRAGWSPRQEGNQVWAINCKGWFRLGDSSRCEPLTLSDTHTRYLLRCQALEHTNGRFVREVLEGAFREYGLPARIRSDNGPPFATTGVGGLSR